MITPITTPKREADENMPRITYSQLVEEAIAALNEGDYEMSADLFRAALPLRMAQEMGLEDNQQGSGEGDVTACTACGKPMRGKVVYTCGGCGTSKASDMCEACYGKKAMSCSACGGSFGRPNVASTHYPTAAEIRTANDDDAYEREYVRKRNKGGKKYPCPTCKKENALTAFEHSKRYQCDECADKAENGVAGY